jgi:two-component system CheB/CheR fusion protein
MLELLVETFHAHGWCLYWDWRWIVPFVVSDVMIAFAYFTIPLALVRVRRDLAMSAIPRKVVFWFSVFITSCGLTHIMDALVIWWPLYGLSLAIRVVCALASVITAVLLWPVVSFYVRRRNGL